MTADSPDPVEVRVLGPLLVRRSDGTRVDPKLWRTGKTADLVRMLALGAGQPIAVDRLLEALWPSVDENHSRASLRTAASQIRRVLGPDCLERRQDGLVLCNVWVDAVAFTALVGEARRCIRDGQLAQGIQVTREAMALYLGDFRTQDADADGVRHESQRLARMHRELVADAADAAVALGQMRDALDFARLSLETDPYSERAHRALMQAHAGLGETDRAVQAFEDCRRMLSESLGVDPAPQTAAAYLQVLSNTPVVAGLTLFVGREAERETLVSTIRSSLRFELPVIATVLGPAGSGKSRLLDEAYRSIPARRVIITCTGADDDRQVVDLVAELSRSAESDEVSGEARLVVIEDLQHAGPRVLDSLSRLVDLLPAPGAVILCARQDEHGADPTAVLADRGGGDRRVAPLTLCPLAWEDVHRLAMELLTAAPTPELVDTLMQSTGGQPGAVIAAAREWSRAGRVALTSRGLTVMPPRDVGEDFAVGSDLARLFHQLTDAELDVALTAAALGQEATAAQIAGVIDEPGRPGGRPGGESDVQGTLDRLADLSMLSVGGSGYAFRQPMLRDALLAWLRPSARRRLHGRIAERALLTSAQRVSHWLEAGEQLLACAAALEAADEAMAAGNYDQARRQLQRVCALTLLREAAPSDRVSIFERLGEADSMVGRLGEARVAYGVALSICRRFGVDGLDRLAAKRDAISRGRSSAMRIGDGPTSTQDVDRRILLGQLGLEPSDWTSERTETLLRDAVNSADRRSDPVQIVETRLLLCDLVYTPRRKLSTSRQWARHALAQTVHPGLRARAMLAAALPAVLLGNAQAEVDQLGEAAGLAARSGDPSLATRIAGIRLLALHDLGNSEFHERRHDLIAADGTALDPRWSWLAIRVQTERGELEGALRADEQPLPPDADPLTRQLRELASAVLQVETGDTEAAANRLRTLVEDAVAEGALLLVPEACAHLVVLNGSHDPTCIRSQFDLLDWATAGEGDLPRESCLRLLARAATRMSIGDHVGAVSAASSAVSIAEAKGLAAMAARSRRVVATASWLAGRPPEASLAATAAARAYRNIGAIPPTLRNQQVAAGEGELASPALRMSTA